MNVVPGQERSTCKLGESGGSFPGDIFQTTFQEMTKCKVQGQVTTLQMPFSYNRKSNNFSSTHVPICVKPGHHASAGKM